MTFRIALFITFREHIVEVKIQLDFFLIHLVCNRQTWELRSKFALLALFALFIRDCFFVFFDLELIITLIWFVQIVI